jgi:hypothetical protein
MPGYIKGALQRFNHPAQAYPEQSSQPLERPDYGAKLQLTPVIDPSEPITPEEKLGLQEVLETPLYYARVIDSTLRPALSDLSTEQAYGTKKTLFKFNQPLNYCHINPEATVRFFKSNMQLTNESNASYLSVSKARSRAASSPQEQLDIMEPMLPFLGMPHHAIPSLIPTVKVFPSSTAGLMA